MDGNLNHFTNQAKDIVNKNLKKYSPEIEFAIGAKENLKEKIKKEESLSER